MGALSDKSIKEGFGLLGVLIGLRGTLGPAPRDNELVHP
jgi:hypothetical protein